MQQYPGLSAPVPRKLRIRASFTGYGMRIPKYMGYVIMGVFAVFLVFVLGGAPWRSTAITAIGTVAVVYLIGETPIFGDYSLLVALVDAVRYLRMPAVQELTPVEVMIPIDSATTEALPPPRWQSLVTEEHNE